MARIPSAPTRWPQRCVLRLRSWLEKWLSPPPGTFHSRSGIVAAWKNRPCDYRVECATGARRRTPPRGTRSESCPTSWISPTSRPSAWSPLPWLPRSPASGRTRPATSRTSTTTTSRSSRRARPRRPSSGCTRILREERALVISSRPLEATVFQVENIKWAYVFYESGLSINVLYTLDDAGKRAVGFKLADGMEVPAELASRFKFARQKSKLAGTIRGSFFVIKGEY